MSPENAMQDRYDAFDDAVRAGMCPHCQGDDLHRPRPFCDWHEDRGDVLWWRIPICEPPYVGSPLNMGVSIAVNIEVAGRTLDTLRPDVGGWPFSDTRNLWWTPLPDAKRIEDQVPL